MKIYADNSLAIGNTPLVKLNSIPKNINATFLAKIEGRNPAYSVKCRVGAGLVWYAEQSGELKPGMEIIEATSGNTGIALAFVAAARGYKASIVMPENMSLERRMLIASFGANIILTPAEQGMAGSVQKAEELAAEYPDRYYLPRQFSNPGNARIHEETTGPEIWNDTDGTVDAFVSSIGTGGTITGISRYLKQQKPVLSIGVEPAKSPVITQHIEGKPVRPGSHNIMGIGAGFIPEVLDLSVVDKVLTVDDETAYEYTRRLAREEGIIAGISSGASVAAAIRAVEELNLYGKTIVIILPDSGERYLSTGLFAVR